MRVVQIAAVKEIDYLHALLSDGTVWKYNDEHDPPQWEPIPLPAEWTVPVTEIANRPS